MFWFKATDREFYFVYLQFKDVAHTRVRRVSAEDGAWELFQAMKLRPRELL